MADVWVINSSPLILLGKSGALALLPEMAKQLIVPASVAQEIMGGPPADPALQWIQEAGASVVTSDVPIPPSILVRRLGTGESSVLAHALNEIDWEGIIDDLAARRAATALGIPFRGTLVVHS